MNKFDLSANLFKVLAHPLRLKILYILAEKNISVCNLAKFLDEKQPKISRALAELKNSGLVTCERNGKTVCYKITSKKFIADILNATDEIIKEQSYKIIKTIQKED